MTKSGMEFSGELTSTGTSLRKHLKHAKNSVWGETAYFSHTILFLKRKDDQPVGVKQSVTATVQIFWLRSAIALWRPCGDGEKGQREQEQGGGDGAAHPQPQPPPRGGSGPQPPPPGGPGHRRLRPFAIRDCLTCSSSSSPPSHSHSVTFPRFQATFPAKQPSIGFR